MQNWYVLYSKPNREFKVLSALQNHGIEGYLPALPAAKKRAGRAPMHAFFPCYLFARFDLGQVGESTIAYLPGLRYLVKTAGIPAEVSPDFVDYVARRLVELVRLDVGGQVLLRGDTVEILDPAFKDIDAVFDSHLSADGRVRVLLRYIEQHRPAYKSFERYYPLELSIEQVQKKQPPKV